MAIKVSLRQKKISKGRKSLYLDFYPPIPNPKTGKPTRREFLGLYILDKAKTPLDKQHNSQTIRIGESIRQQRENTLNKPEIYSQYEKEQLRIKEAGEQCFVEYFKKLIETKKGSTKKSWTSVLKYIVEFTGDNLKFSELNETKLEEFKTYLLTTNKTSSNKTTLSQNSAASYFNKVKTALKQAYKEGILQEDLNAKVEPIKEEETRIQFLTIEELNELVRTPCNNPLLKRAALFSCLTGMAFAEIRNMIWSDVSFITGHGYQVLTKRQKTERDNYLPISKQAYSFTEGTIMPHDMPQDKPVFEGLKYASYHSKSVFQWIGAAGITKHITFHCFRHTFATMQLFAGTSLYTVSKLLGHKNTATTQIYAKVVDETKRKAAEKIQLDLEGFKL